MSKVSGASACAIVHLLEQMFVKNNWQWRTTFVDFLHATEMHPEVINCVRRLRNPQELHDWLLQLQTGESHAAFVDGHSRSKLGASTPTEKDKEAGEATLLDIAARLYDAYWRIRSSPLSRYQADGYENSLDAMLESLRADGFNFRNGALIESDIELVEPEVELGILARRFKLSGLPNHEELDRIVKEAEARFAEENWRSSNVEWRAVLQNVQKEVAQEIHPHRLELKERNWNADKPVREFLHKCGFYTEDEMNLMGDLYGFISERGPHGGVSEKEQARLTRNLVLSMSQYILDRYEVFKGFGYKDPH